MKNDKRKYEKPSVKIVAIQIEDIITTSYTNDPIELPPLSDFYRL